MDRIRKIAPLIIFFVLVIAAASYAQQVTKIAIVDAQRAFQNSVEGKRAQAQLQDKETKIKTDLQKMDDSIRLLENRMNTGRLTMTNEALLALQADIDKKTTERKRYEEDGGRDLQQLAGTLTQKIRIDMLAIIEALAKERGIELVLDTTTSGVLSASQTIDITDEVVRRYDQSKAAPAPAAPVKK